MSTYLTTFLIIKILFYFFFCFTIFLVASSFYLTKETLELHAADMIVVLGCGTLADGSLSAVQKGRVNTAVELYEKRLAQRMLITGGATESNFVEADIMKTYALEMGIPEDAIFVERQSLSTEENARFSTAILNENNAKKIIIVTSTFHTRRAALTFRAYGFEVQTVVAAYPGRFSYSLFTRVIFVEYFGILYHYFKRPS